MTAGYNYMSADDLDHKHWHKAFIIILSKVWTKIKIRFWQGEKETE